MTNIGLLTNCRGRTVSTRVASTVAAMWSVVIWIASASVADAQTTALDCVPPAAPIAVTDASLSQEFRNEIKLAYSDYFTMAGDYLRCLESARATVDQEIKSAIEAYQQIELLK